MRYMLLTLSICSLFTCQTGLAQEKENTLEEQYFAMIYTVGENWDTLKAVNEQAYFETHSRHLSALRKAKKIVIGGRYDNKGFMVLKATSFQEAESIVKQDSSVLYKTFHIELFPFNTFYKGCVD